MISVDHTFTINMVVCLDLLRAKRVVYLIWKIYGCLVIGTCWKIRAVSDDCMRFELVTLIGWIVDASFRDCKSRLRFRHVRRVINLGNSELATSFAELKLNDLLIN